MGSTAIFMPILAQVFLMILISFWLVWARVGSVVRKKVDIKDVAKLGWQGWIKNAGDNYTNQYEMPVLFFVLCFVAYLTGNAGHVFVTLAWIYFGLRVVHAVIHVSYNNIGHRFFAFLLSALTMTSMFVLLTAKLV